MSVCDAEASQTDSDVATTIQYDDLTGVIMRARGDAGETLVEVVLTVVGITNLASKGSTSACSASRNAAKSASAIYFVSNANAQPISFTQLTTAGVGGAPPTLPSNVTINSATSLAPAVPTGNCHPAVGI
jgi:hypothetical protein